MTRHPIWCHDVFMARSVVGQTEPFDADVWWRRRKCKRIGWKVFAQSTRICMETLNLFILYLRLVGLASPTITTRYSFHNARSLTTNLEKNEGLRSLVIIKKKETKKWPMHNFPTHTYIYTYTFAHTNSYRHTSILLSELESWRNSFTPLAVGTRNMY